MSNELFFFNYAANCRLRPYVLFLEQNLFFSFGSCLNRATHVRTYVLRITYSKTVRVVELEIINNTRTVPLPRSTLRCVAFSRAETSPKREERRENKRWRKKKERTWYRGSSWTGKRCRCPWEPTSSEKSSPRFPSRSRARTICILHFPRSRSKSINKHANLFTISPRYTLIRHVFSFFFFFWSFRYSICLFSFGRFGIRYGESEDELDSSRWKWDHELTIGNYNS